MKFSRFNSKSKGKGSSSSSSSRFFRASVLFFTFLIMALQVISTSAQQSSASQTSMPSALLQNSTNSFFFMNSTSVALLPPQVSMPCRTALSSNIKNCGHDIDGSNEVLCTELCMNSMNSFISGVEASCTSSPADVNALKPLNLDAPSVKSYLNRTRGGLCLKSSTSSEKLCVEGNRQLLELSASFPLASENASELKAMLTNFDKRCPSPLSNASLHSAVGAIGVTAQVLLVLVWSAILW